MRFSIKYKIPLIMLFLFVFFSTSLLLYFRYVGAKEYKADIDTAFEHLFMTSREIAEEISRRYPDADDIGQYLDSVAKKDKLKIQVLDSLGNKVMEVDYSDSGYVLKTNELVKVEEKIPYIIQVEKKYKVLRNILGVNIFNGLVYFSIILLFVIFLFLVFYLHYYIVKPLELLQKNMKKVDFRNHPIDIILKRKDEMGDLSNRFEEMVKKLEEAHIQQIEMLSSISHDLKTPLTSIIGYVERLLMKNGKSEERKQEYYQIIYKKAMDIEKLLEEFTDFAKNESDILMTSKETVEIEKFFDEIYEEYAIELEGLNVKLYCEKQIEEKVMMDIDTKKIRRIFANLISNALKYGETSTAIKLCCTLEKGMVRFAVEDNGKGIPSEELAHIFEKFYRIDKSRSPEKGGTGLGLAICKSIVEKHRGNIKAYNVPTGGLGIEFYLPIRD